MDEADIEKLEKTLAEPYYANKPSGSFTKCIKDTIETTEAAHCSYTPSQVVTKVFNAINKANVCPEGHYKWKQKLTSDKMWANLKVCFSWESKECRKHQHSAAKEDYYVASITNQASLEAQSKFRNHTTKFLAEFQDTMSKENVPPVPTQ